MALLAHTCSLLPLSCARPYLGGSPARGPVTWKALGQGKGLPQCKLFLLQAVEGPPAPNHTPQPGRWGTPSHACEKSCSFGTLRGINQPTHHLSIQVRSCCQMRS